MPRTVSPQRNRVPPISRDSIAGKHPQAEVAGLAEPLGQLSEKFILAEKPLTFIAERYLSLRKHQIFPL